MKQNKLLIVGAKIIKNKKESKFGGKDYAMHIQCKTISEGEAKNGMRQNKVIFPNNRVHEDVFDLVNDYMKKSLGDDYKEKGWKVLENESGMKADFMKLETPIEINGYMAKFKLPDGEKIIQKTETGTTEKFFLNVLCIGEQQTRDRNGDIIPAWGEIPYEIYANMRDRGVLNVVKFDSKATAFADEFEDDNKDTEKKDDL